MNVQSTAYEGNAPDMGAYESPYGLTVDENGTLPSQYTLFDPYPNPFNTRTTVGFSLGRGAFVRLIVYDLKGREVETIVGRAVDPGHHITEWNATGVPSGVYFIRMEARGFFSEMSPVYVLQKKLVLLK